MKPGDSASMAGIWAAARYFLTALGAALAAHGMADSGLYAAVQFAAATIMILGPAAWGIWRAIANYLKIERAQVSGVKAGIAAQFVGAAPPPSAVSPAHAKDLIARFG